MTITSWSDRKTASTTSAPKTPYIKLVNGANRLRIVSSIGDYVCAQVVLPKSKNQQWGDRIRLSANGEDPIRKHFASIPLKGRHLFVAINRATKSIGLLDTSSVIRDGIYTILDTKNDGSEKVITPIDFDINIIKNPKSTSPALYYQVSAYDNSPLSNEDIKMLEEFGSVDEALEVAITPPSVEQVEKRLSFLGWVSPS
jgi:hypothetical protein